MDRKSILVLVVSFLVLMVWYPLMYKVYPPKPIPRTTNALAQATNVARTTNASAEVPAAAVSNTIPRLSAAALASPKSRSSEELLTWENNLARYTFTSFDGGLKMVELKKYPETVGRGKKQKAPSTQLASVNARAPMPMLSVFGDDLQPDDANYQLRKTATGVVAEKSFTNGLRLIKEFNLSSNYLFAVKARWENTTTNSIRLPMREWVVGTATPINPYDDARMMGAYWYDGRAASHVDQNWFANRTLGCVPGIPRSEFTGGDGRSNVVWTALHNQFFTIAAIPQSPAPRVVVRKIDLPMPTTDELRADTRMVAKPFGFEGSIVYPETTIAPGQTNEQVLAVYAGPREYNTLARIGSDMDNNLDAIMGFSGFFGFFAKALLLSLNGLHNFLSLSYGWAIIAITVIIKLLFWPLTNFSTRSMKRMAALQPQMKALQEKYKDDPKKMNLKLMEYMKENRISPMSGCFPILFQIPVFVGFYNMLQSAIELRGASFLWARDLSQPDTIFMIPGLDFPVNPLPLFMGASMLWQSHLTPPSPGMDPMQQKIMKYMPLMFIVFLYNFSAGLSLYWTVQNLLSILQMKMTKTIDPLAPAPVKSTGGQRPNGSLKRRT
jgi:YidC/Oxa1 family membrane protein insertase